MEMFRQNPPRAGYKFVDLTKLCDLIWKAYLTGWKVILNRPEIKKIENPSKYDATEIGEALKEAFVELDLELKAWTK